MSSPKISKSSILSALNETTKQAAKAEAEKKRLAEEAQKAKELKREQQREDRIKRREEKQRLKTIEAEKKKTTARKSREEEKAIAEFTAKNSGDINETMMGEQWENLSDDEGPEEGANKTLFKKNDEDEDINSPDYKKGKSTGGGCLKSDWRYSTRDEGTRKSKTLEHKDSPFWKMAIELVEKDEYDKRNKKKLTRMPLLTWTTSGRLSPSTTHNRSKTNSKVKFGPKLDDDKLSAGSTSAIDTLDHYRNTESMGKPPSNEQASTSVVSPSKGSVDGSIPAASG